MFQLHDKTRFRLCLAGFVLFGLLPTLWCGGWCIGRHLPGRAAAEAVELGRLLGVSAKLAGLKFLRPGAVLYEGLELSDRETGRAILRCRLLEVASGHAIDPEGQHRAVVVITATQPEVESAAAGRIWQCLERVLDGSIGPLQADVKLSAAELTLRDHNNSQTVSDVAATLETLRGATRAEVEFRLAGIEVSEPVRILVDRNRQVVPPASSFHLNTGDVELPCHLLAMGVSELGPLGSRCRFRGHIWADETPQGWTGEVVGQVIELDLGSLVSDHFPYKLSGIGQLTIQSAHFRGSRLEEGAAALTAGPGIVDRALLAAAVDRLGVVPGNEPEQAGERIRYEQLAMFATLDAQGLQVRGRCDEAGTLLRDDRDRLLSEPSQPQPVAALVQTLAPQSAVQVPASRQTDWLLRHLPLPEVVPPASAEAAVPRGRLRLKDTLRR